MKTYRINKNSEENVLTNETLIEMRERIVRSFLDVIVLVNLRDGSPMGGYELIKFIHQRFDILMSPGTVYSFLYSLERDGLIKGAVMRRKRMYMLTDEGENRIKTILEAKPRILDMMAELFI